MKTSTFCKAVGAFLLTTGLLAAEPAWPPDTFTCYYGPITSQAAQEMKDLDLLVVHPGEELDNLNTSKIESLRKVGREKTIVGYVTVGEDDQPPGGPPIIGEDTSGPSYVGKDLKVKLSGKGYPMQFLDQRRFVFGDDGFLQFGPDGKPLIEKGQDGHPDENGVWGSYYVRTDSKAWEERVFAIMDKLDAMGVDGFFLDTVDTASPWGDYGWTAPTMLEFVGKIRKRYPDKKIVANRGLWYLAENDKYAKLIDAVLFESLLTHYNWEAETGEISPWAKWHVIALDDDVKPSQKRTGVHLLVLDYLNPEQADVVPLVQSDRTLLQNTPHSLSFNHPALQKTGWTSSQILSEEQPSGWPTLQNIELAETEPGAFELKASFSGDVPTGAIPDLRFTTETEIKPEQVAGLPPAQVTDWKAEKNTIVVRGSGLDKATNYTAYLRLISAAEAPQTGFGWSGFATAQTDIPSQVSGLSHSSVPNGLQLSFTSDSIVADGYRVYRMDGGKRLLAEGKKSPIVLSDLDIGDTASLMVVAVGKGKEGYPSAHYTAVRQDVTPPAVPGAVRFEQDGETSRFSWDSVAEAGSYRLYVIPKGETFRLPTLSEESEFEVDNVVPGEYKVFLTTVDGAGNQSRPGPSVTVTVE